MHVELFCRIMGAFKIPSRLSSWDRQPHPTGHRQISPIERSPQDPLHSSSRDFSVEPIPLLSGFDPECRPCKTGPAPHYWLNTAGRTLIDLSISLHAGLRHILPPLFLCRQRSRRRHRTISSSRFPGLSNLLRHWRSGQLCRTILPPRLR